MAPIYLHEDSPGANPSLTTTTMMIDQTSKPNQKSQRINVFGNLDKIKNGSLRELKRTQKEIQEKTLTMILAAFGLVAALAWNDAIQTMFRVLFPESQGLTGKFLYAISITIIVVIISVQLRKVFEQKST